MSGTPAGDGGVVLDRSAFLLDFDENFRDAKLDSCRWVAKGTLPLPGATRLAATA